MTESQCQTCQGSEMITCPACKGKAGHWCHKDRAVLDTGRGDYCQTGIDCQSCENDGYVTCPARCAG